MTRLILLGLLAFSVVCARADAAPNGQLPGSALSSIGGCAKLRNDAAAAYNTMQLAAGRKLPVNGCSSAYRRLGRSGDYPDRYGSQFYFRGYWCARSLCGNAAVPGTSNHGWGLAVDVPWSVRTTIDQIGRKFGWAKNWSDAPHEWWHLKWRSGVWKRRPNPGTNLKSPTLRYRSGGPGQASKVRHLQAWLRRRRAVSFQPSGSFGSRTRAGVKRYQRRVGLRADGVAGPRTWTALRNPRIPHPSNPRR